MIHLSASLALLATIAVIVVWSVDSTSSAASAHECHLYLGPSSILNAGRGVFAGANLSNSTILAESRAIPVLRNHTTQCQLDNYVFDTGFDDFCMIIIGLGSLFNHNIPPSVGYVWGEGHLVNPLDTEDEGYSQFLRTEFKANQDVIPGQELFISYGGSWLSERGYSEGNETAVHMALSFNDSYLCASTITLDTSSIPNAGLGVFATRSFKKGELVSFSPVLALDEELVADTFDSSTLMNYCLAAEESQVVLLPLAPIGLVNHADEPNVYVNWLNWPSTNRLEETLQLPVDALLRLPYAPLDIAYYASRDIQEGEELFMDYGHRWSTAWAEYVQCLESPEESCASFRHFIVVPQSMFPEHWLDEEEVMPMGREEEGEFVQENVEFVHEIRSNEL
ncbi:SET domain-containing protein-lysine N-methyltransferase [archaeon]|nr:MAG: SET domain-containing protein-lysine N-methyltransferase [archaeon]